jgi:long-subunit acyl-CoA synthetase (AMP-forming)
MHVVVHVVLADLCVLVAGVLQAAVGGRMRLFISGGAPLPTYAGTFMATAMNVPVLQVRGLAGATTVMLAKLSHWPVTQPAS